MAYPGVAYHKDYKWDLNVHQGPEVEKNNKLCKIVHSKEEHKRLGPDWGYKEEVNNSEVEVLAEEEVPKKRSSRVK